MGIRSNHLITGSADVSSFFCWFLKVAYMVHNGIVIARCHTGIGAVCHNLTTAQVQEGIKVGQPSTL